VPVVTFVRTALVILGILAALGAPLWFVAWRQHRRDTIRNFAVGAGVVAILAGIVAMTSERAVEQCIAANGRDCIDPGGSGVQVVLVVFYLLANWFVAYKMWSD
jgi:hypothetical protein